MNWRGKQFPKANSKFIHQLKIQDSKEKPESRIQKSALSCTPISEVCMDTASNYSKKIPEKSHYQ